MKRHPITLLYSPCVNNYLTRGNSAKRAQCGIESTKDLLPTTITLFGALWEALH